MNSRESVDVLVIGAGASGIAASLSAAQAGAQVLLVDSYSEIGGTAVQVAVGTICGLYENKSDAAVYHPGRFAREFAEALILEEGSSPLCFKKKLWFLPYKPESFLRHVQSLIEKATSVEACCNTRVVDGSVEAGVVQTVTLQHGDTLRLVEVKSVIDCSGGACVSRIFGIPLMDDVTGQDHALVAELSFKNLDLADKRFLKRMIEEVFDGNLPRQAQEASIIPGSLSDSSFRVKLPVYSADITEAAGKEAAVALLKQMVAATGDLGFALEWVAPKLGVRSGQKVQGESFVSRDDVLQGVKYELPAAFCSWPIEFWGPGGGLRLEMLAEGDYYNIPQAALSAKGIDNLFLAGMMVAGDADATASFRVIGTCFETGVSAGLQAAAKASCISQADVHERLKQEFEVADV